jgi:hypothetical protein
VVEVVEVVEVDVLVLVDVEELVEVGAAVSADDPDVQATRAEARATAAATSGVRRRRPALNAGPFPGPG